MLDWDGSFWGWTWIDFERCRSGFGWSSNGRFTWCEIQCFLHNQSTPSNTFQMLFESIWVYLVYITSCMIPIYRSILVNYYDTCYIYIYIRYIMDLCIYNIIHIKTIRSKHLYSHHFPGCLRTIRFCWVFPRSMLFQNGRTVNQLFDALSAGKVWAGLVVVTSNCHKRHNEKGEVGIFYFVWGRVCVEVFGNIWWLLLLVFLVVLRSKSWNSS